MGADDDGSCIEHVWALKGLHLSLVRGVETTEECERCGTTRTTGDPARSDPGRRPLPPTRPLPPEWEV